MPSSSPRASGSSAAGRRSSTLLLFHAALAVAATGDCPCPGYCDGKSPALPAGEGPPPGLITVSPTPGAANCTTISGAIALTRFAYRDRYTIEIAPGRYVEKVTIEPNRPPITLRGMNGGAPDAVLVQWFDCDGCVTPSDGVGEWGDQTLFVGAADFRAENISFAGSSRESAGRNMALQVQADRAFFAHARFYGAASDTLYTGGSDHRAYFTRCFVNGTYDFIWGVGSAVFDRCTIVGSDNVAAHKGSQVNRDGVLGGCVGAALLGRSCTAFLMDRCVLPRPPGYGGSSTTLGRPWRSDATVVWKSCWMDGHIAPGGWLVKGIADATNITFAEFNTTGPGARQTRDKPGAVLTAAEASNWTQAAVLKGWNPHTPSQAPWGA